MNITFVNSDQLGERLRTPFNPPLLSEEFTEDNFHSEWHGARNALDHCLSRFGKWDAYGNGDYFLDEVANLSRGIGVELNNPTMLSKEFVRSVQSCLGSLDQEYEIDFALMVDGDFFDILVSQTTVTTDCPKALLNELLD